MTTKEMSDFLNSLWCWARCTEEEQRKLSEIADYLSNQGNEKNDCISRERAIGRLKLNLPISDGADNSKDRYRYMQSLADIQAIRELPSVTPQEPKTGEWLRMSDLSEQEDDRYKCSRCGNVVHHKDKMNLYTFNSWCGRCGSDNGRHINYEVEE